MCVVAIVGGSGTGKTSIVDRLIETDSQYFHVIDSFTDRPKRYEFEEGHTFIGPHIMETIFNSSSVVARTMYGDYRYCSTIEQFRRGFINLYVVDNQGVIDLKEYFEGTGKVLVVQIVRDNPEDIDSDRVERDTLIDEDLVDYTIHNNESLDDACTCFAGIMRKEFKRKILYKDDK